MSQKCLQKQRVCRILTFSHPQFILAHLGHQRLILTYLIPCHLLTTHTLPSRTLLRPYPRLSSLFTPLCICIRSGNLSGFDAALAAGEDEFVRRRIYLTLERGRDIALRNLLRKVFISGGYEEGKDGGEKIRRTRIPLDEFVAAVRLGSSADGNRVESDEVECLLANMIYKVCPPPSFFLHHHLHHIFFLLCTRPPAPPLPSPFPQLLFLAPNWVCIRLIYPAEPLCLMLSIVDALPVPPST